MSYIYVWEHFGSGRHIDANWSPIFEDLFNLELDFRIFVWLVCFLFSFIGSSDAPTPFTMHFSRLLSAESCESFHYKKPLGMLR